MRYLYSFIFWIFLYPTLFAQFSIQGKVTNEKGEKLPYATVFLEGTTRAAATDEQGKFLITNITQGTYSLKVTFVGYRSWMTEIDVTKDFSIDIVMRGEIYHLDKIEIQANRVGDKGIFSRQNLSKKELQKENLGQDVPFILQWTPSLVVTSDAGTGIGYTGLRLRGSDQTRVNVIINGVPLNDAESQNVFWVDLPDLMGSVNNIQIQRGVGTSTNGAGAFGGTVSINTADIRIQPYVDISGTIGAFDTRKIGINLGTGLLNHKYMIDARYST
ncbi:MAG: TonB-dependent receptor, partial [Saprospiraceae bacterium]